MLDYRHLNMLRLITGSLLNRTPLIIVNSAAANANSPVRRIHLSIASRVDYKTPTNSHKVFRPSTVPVTKQNKHLIVDLSDENGQEVGKVNLNDANEMAKSKGLRLVIMDESTSPPKFKLLPGSELFKIQMQAKQNAEGDTEKEPHVRNKEVQINLGIDEHDLEVKVKMANSFLEKGHTVNILVKTKGREIKGKNISKLQETLLGKLESTIKNGKIKVKSKDEFNMNLLVNPNK